MFLPLNLRGKPHVGSTTSKPKGLGTGVRSREHARLNVSACSCCMACHFFGHELLALIQTHMDYGLAIITRLGG
jgi:hypothetical protein